MNEVDGRFGASGMRTKTLAVAICDSVIGECLFYGEADVQGLRFAQVLPAITRPKRTRRCLFVKWRGIPVGKYWDS